MRTTRTWVPAAIVVSLTALIAGCASTAVNDRRWEGHRINELVASIGPADRIMTYPYGGTLYIWELRDTRLEPADASTIDDSPRLADSVMARVFLVDDNGVIVRTQVDHGGR
jgi:hypothetical protein